MYSKSSTSKPLPLSTSSTNNISQQVNAPVVFAIVLRWPSLQRFCSVLGLSLLCLSLACSSFATTTNQLVATQGVMYAIGGGLVYSPTVV